MIRYILISLIIMCVGTTLSAQSLFDKTLQIEEVIVNEKSPVRESAVTKTIIDSLQLSESVNMSFAELLSKHTPIFIKTYGLGSLATVSFRGTAASHTQVEWNGVNINNPMLGQVDFSMIPVWFVDKTELLHGGSSLQEGGGALGGSVIIGSSPRWNDKFYGSVMQSVGSFQNYQTFLSVGGGNKNVQVSARYIYQEAQNDFKFLNSAVPPFDYQRQNNADYRKHGATADVFMNLGKGHFISVNSWFHTANRNLPTIMSYEGKGREEWQQDDELRVVGKWAWYGKNIKSELISGYTSTALDYYLANITDMGKVVNYDSRSKIGSFYNKYKLEWNAGTETVIRAIANANFHDVAILDHRTQEGYGANRTELGISISAHHRLSEKFSGYALARYENSGSFMPSVGIEGVFDALTVKLNGTRNYHQPTLNDLHWLPGGNPELKPERGYTADISAQYKYRRYCIGIVGYMSWIDDWIIWRPSEFRYWTATNIKKVFARGFEVNLSSEHNIGNVKIGIRANYAYTRTTNQQPDLEGDASKGKQLIYIPVNKANIMIDASYRGFFAYYTWSYTGERFTNSSNEVSRHVLPAYDLHNVTIGKRFRKMEVQAKVENIFNKNYQAILWRAMPRRNYQIILKYTF